MDVVNAFIIHRPYQVLNAVEYAKRAGLRRCRLFVVEDEELSTDYFAEIADESVWESIEVCPLRDWFDYADLSHRRPETVSEYVMEKVQLLNQIRKRRIVDRLAKRIGRVSELVLGSYRESYAGYMRHIANRVPHSKLVLIDVGTDTLEINRQRIDEYARKQRPATAVPARDFSFFRRLHQALRTEFVEWDTQGVVSATFFSCYDLKVAPSDHLLKNDYRNLRSTLGDRAGNGETWFLGQPIADQQYLSWESFRRLISFVIQRYGSEKLVYIAHPYESSRQLDLIKNVGARVARFEKPIEIALSSATEVPSVVSGFFSSAISGCAAIFGDALDYEAIRIPESMLEKQRENLSEIYQSFTDNESGSIIVVCPYSE
jgi:hypothetical protein